MLLLRLQAVRAQLRESFSQGFVMTLGLSCVAGLATVKAAEGMQLQVMKATVSV